MTEKLKQEVNPLSAVVQQVAKICPAAVQNGKIDFERLRTEWSADLNEPDMESYNFTWVGKNAAIAEANKKIRKTLRPVKADSKNWENTQNLYIEGDNLDVLKLLQESYLGKVKMIYIDPPYNTGNDFVYCDDFTLGCEEYIEKKGQCDIETNERLFRNTETNGRFHSDWCSMIYPRLKIARDLLSDDGVIFISIDDNEQANLKKICDEVFGESNFIGFIVWAKGNAQNDADNIQKNHEYIICYSKKIANISEKKFIDKKVFKDENGWFYEGSGLTTGGAGGTLKNRPNLGYSIYFNPTTKDKIAVCDYDIQKVKASDSVEELYEDDINLIQRGYNVVIRAPKKISGLGCWTWALEKFNTEKDRILIKQTSRGYSVCKKEYVNESMVRRLSDGSFVVSIKQETPIRSIVNNISSANGTLEVSEIFNNKYFDHPKPIALISFLIKSISNDAIILDFFSGSATTAHAVMQLNAEDGGNRKFIMVQLPEATDEKSEAYKAGYKNICEIGKERIRRAGDKIMSEHPDAKIDTGFRVFRLDDTNMKDVYYKPVDTAQDSLLDMVDNIKPDRTDMDLLFGAMLERGLTLDMPVEEVQSNGITYYVVNNGNLIACFAENIPESVIREIANRRPYLALFRDSSFAESKDKINLTEIFKNVDSNIKVCVL